MRAGPIVIFHVTEQQVTEVALAEHNTWSRHSLRIEPISLSAYPFCQGERGDVGRSRMPIDRSLRIDLTIGAVAVTNEIAGSLFPAAGFRDLICDLICDPGRETNIKAGGDL